MAPTVTQSRDLAGAAALELALQYSLLRQDRSYHFTQLLTALFYVLFLIELILIIFFSTVAPSLPFRCNVLESRVEPFVSYFLMLLFLAAMLLVRAVKKRFVIEPGDVMMERLNHEILEACIGLKFNIEEGRLFSDQRYSGAHMVGARRIIAVGDLHGDFNQTLTVLRLTGLTDKYNQWIGGDTYLVQLGDILDVGPDDILIVRTLMKLKQQARAAGGDVIQLLGNHEIRNLAGDYTAVDPASLAASGGKAGRAALLSNTSSVGIYLRTRQAIFIHGPLLFMHGGFSRSTSVGIKSIHDVSTFNSELQHALMNGTISTLASHGLNLTEDNVDDVANPILVRSIRNVRCEDIHKVLNDHFPGIESIVVGHVPHNPNSFRKWRLCDGRLIDIDFGMSRWKNGDPGHVAALEINDETHHVQLIETKMEYTDYSGKYDQSEDAKWHFYSSVTVIIAIFAFFILFATSALTCMFCRERTKPALLSSLKF